MKSILHQRSHSNKSPVLAIDMTALWNRKTTGIQRVIRELSPYLAMAAARRGWEIVLVRKTEIGLEELTRWTGDFDPVRLSTDLDLIANGSCRDEGLAHRFRQTARRLRQARIGPFQLRQLTSGLRSVVPLSIREVVRGWKRKDRKICASADAYLSLAGGILPSLPPPGTPPERTVIVIHDLIPLHYSAYYSAEIVNAFVMNLSQLAFSPYASKGRFVTASRHVATDIDELFYALARKQVAIDVTDWGYDRNTFFRQEDSDFRSKLGLPKDAFIVGAVSTPDPRKRFVDIQAAVAEMNAVAVFVGESQPSRQHNAIYLGRVADDVLRSAYSSCDVIVNWSAAEGFGLPTIEALACGGRVVIPPDNPTSIEVGGKNVIVAERADVQALRQAIRRAASLPRPQPDLSRFQWTNSAALLERLLWPEARDSSCPRSCAAYAMQ